MTLDDGDELPEDTLVYGRLDDGTIITLGTFSSMDAVHAELEDRYDEYVGNITLFTRLGSYTLPRPFPHLSADEHADLERIVDQFAQSPYVADAHTASAGGATHVGRSEMGLDLSARDYDFSFHMTPDEEQLDTDGTHLCRYAERFNVTAEAIGVADTVEFVAGDHYVPRRGAQHHNIRLYGRYVPDNPSDDLIVQRAFLDRDDVADAFPAYNFRTAYIWWVEETEDIYRELRDVDMVVLLDDGRHPVSRNDVDDYNIHTSSSLPFDYSDLVDSLHPVVEEVDAAVDANVTVRSVGVYSTTIPDIGDLPIAGIRIGAADDE